MKDSGYRIASRFTAAVLVYHLCGSSVVQGETRVSAYGQTPTNSLDCGTVLSAINAPVENSCATSDYYPFQDRWSANATIAWGRSEVGRLKVQAVGTTSAASPSSGSWGGAADTTAETQWTDSLTVNAAGLAGQLGEMTVHLALNGDITLSGGDPYAGTGLASGANSKFALQTQMTGSLGASTNFNGGAELRYVSGGGTQVFAYNGVLLSPGTVTLKLPFHFGNSSQLLMRFQAIANGRVSVYGPADGVRTSVASSDFTNGVTWAGITEVRGPGGLLVTNFTVTSTSGFDYHLGAFPNELRITNVWVVPAGLALTWSDNQARSYTVETRPSLTAGTWATASGVSWPIATNTVTLPGPLTTNAFFRIKAQ
jgi:hypothetical protein